MNTVPSDCTRNIYNINYEMYQKLSRVCNILRSTLSNLFRRQRRIIIDKVIAIARGQTL